MIFDQQTLLSDAQAVTATAVSTNVIDLGPIATGLKRDIGKGKQIPLLIQVVEDFAAAGAATMHVEVQVSEDEAFTSPTVAYTTKVGVPVADLVAGYVFVPEYVTRYTDERYLRLNYVVGTGPMTAGKITAGVTMGNQSNG